jgi:hypothetical protein
MLQGRRTESWQEVSESDLQASHGPDLASTVPLQYPRHWDHVHSHVQLMPGGKSIQTELQSELGTSAGLMSGQLVGAFVWLLRTPQACAQGSRRGVCHGVRAEVWWPMQGCCSDVANVPKALVQCVTHTAFTAVAVCSEALWHLLVVVSVLSGHPHEHLAR